MSPLPRSFRALGLLLMLLAVAAGPGCGSEERPQPNLILITVDHLATDELACFGGPAESGRSLCRLGEQGTLFGWAFAPGRGIASSAATVLTGLPEASHGVDDSGVRFLEDAHETIAERLGRDGYTSAAFVTSPRLNSVRRLDQGFDHYDDRFASPSELPTRIQSWLARARVPYFVWIHLERDGSPADVDWLFSRLEGLFAGEVEVDGEMEEPPGVLFAALRGAPLRPAVPPSDSESGIRLASHRVPILWRAPGTRRAELPRVSFDLASLLDLAPTLARSAHRPFSDPAPEATLAGLPGRSLDSAPGEREDRFLLLADGSRGSEVGLVSGPFVYVRRISALDISGGPIPTPSLSELSPRFLMRSTRTPALAGSAGIADPAWREDVLSTDSPVPRLEFHLARQLREQAEAISGRGQRPFPGLASGTADATGATGATAATERID